MCAHALHSNSCKCSFLRLTRIYFNNQTRYLRWSRRRAALSLLIQWSGSDRWAAIILRLRLQTAWPFRNWIGVLVANSHAPSKRTRPINSYNDKKYSSPIYIWLIFSLQWTPHAKPTMLVCDAHILEFVI